MTKIRLVLIEDHDLTRIGLRTALMQCDNIEIVGEAANAANGLNLLYTCRPDIAIVDIGLPDLDGVELTQRFKHYQLTREDLPTKILILTLQDNEDSVMAAFAAGADSYCMKDISFDNLLEAVKTTYEGNSWVDPTIAGVVLNRAKSNGMSALREVEHDRKTVAIHSVSGDYRQIIDTYPLTERELEVLQLIVGGCSNAEIAQKLYITVGTAKTHVRNILNKLCADDRTQAAVRALRAGLVH